MMQDTPQKAFECYHELLRRRTERRSAGLEMKLPSLVVPSQGRRDGTQEVVIHNVVVRDERGRAIEVIGPNQPVSVELQYEAHHPITDFALTLTVVTETEVKCFELALPSSAAHFGVVPVQGTIECHFSDVPLLPGCYFLNVGTYPTDWSYVYDYHWRLHPLRVMSDIGSQCSIHGFVRVEPKWRLHQTQATLLSGVDEARDHDRL
jgi:lipopolysaccharide transport system ATP-binding protein